MHVRGGRPLPPQDALKPKDSNSFGARRGSGPPSRGRGGPVRRGSDRGGSSRGGSTRGGASRGGSSRGGAGRGGMSRGGMSRGGSRGGFESSRGSMRGAAGPSRGGRGGFSRGGGAPRGGGLRAFGANTSAVGGRKREFNSEGTSMNNRRRPLGNGNMPVFKKRRFEKDPPIKPSADEEEKIKRTLICYGLTTNMTEELLKRFFSEKVAPDCVEDVKLVQAKGKSSGVAFVELKDESLVKSALALNATLIFGNPITIELSDSAESLLSYKRRQQLKAIYQNDPTRLFFGNAYRGLSEDHLKELFSPFGEVEYVKLAKNSEKGSLGFGCIKFAKGVDGKIALNHLNGMLLMNKALRCGWTLDSVSTLGTKMITEGVSLDDLFKNGDISEKMSEAKTAAVEKVIKKQATEVNSEKENQQADDIPETRCVKIENCFDIEEEEGDDWKEDLENDVKEEFEEDYGPVVHIFADETSSGEIYVKFADVESKNKCMADFAKGKYFSGNRATCHDYSELLYSVKFPNASK